MHQTSFFDPPRPTAPRAVPTVPYVATSETSAAAAKSIAPLSGRLQAAVLAFIRQRGAIGATDEEISLELGLLSDTARARRVELRDRGLIADSGRRRATRRGRQAVVWIARPQ